MWVCSNAASGRRMSANGVKSTRAGRPGLTDVGLPVWHAREGEGYWNPEWGIVSVPKGWVFVPAGTTFVTREVKKGPHWILLKRRKGYTATLGVFCPEASLTDAEKRRDETAESRARQRGVGRASRERAESRYRTSLERAVLEFLSFAPQHKSLALEIAEGSVAHATPVGSGRVGRTRKLSLSERAELAVRAYIRHKHTNYEALLWDLRGEDPTVDVEDEGDPGYRQIKAEAQRETDEFLRRHRAVPS